MEIRNLVIGIFGATITFAIFPELATDGFDSTFWLVAFTAMLTWATILQAQATAVSARVSLKLAEIEAERDTGHLIVRSIHHSPTRYGGTVWEMTIGNKGGAATAIEEISWIGKDEETPIFEVQTRNLAGKEKGKPPFLRLIETVNSELELQASAGVAYNPGEIKRRHYDSHYVQGQPTAGDILRIKPLRGLPCTIRLLSGRNYHWEYGPGGTLIEFWDRANELDDHAIDTGAIEWKFEVVPDEKLQAP